MSNEKLSPEMKQLLKNRGIVEETEIEEYLSLKPQRTYDPFIMKGMREAVDLILQYADEKRKICIYGDYDADGVTSVTVLLTIFRELTDNVIYYIPDRFREGYGLNCGAIDFIAEQGAELIITVDNGCVAWNEIQYIKEKGMEVIVTDHHNIGAQLPDCIMLNPKQPGDDYPFAFLCGCGIAFKLAQALTRERGLDRKAMNALLDLVGIATVGDIVPLVDENRTLVKYGIDRLRRNNRPGMARLLEFMKIKPETISSYSIAFGIVPRLNSCGRMRHASLGVSLLSGKEPEKIRELAEEICALNEARKKEQDLIFRAAEEWLRSLEGIPDFIVYYAGNAHEGVTGIVAGKLKEEYYRPTVLLTNSAEGVLKGTGRSIPGVDLHRLLSRYKHMFLRFGGHAGACGFSMKKEMLASLVEGLQEDMQLLITKQPDLLMEKTIPDLVIDADVLNLQFAQEIARMEPFGEGNPKPVFEVTNITIQNIRRMGKDQKYRKLQCTGCSGNPFEAVSFLSDNSRIDMLQQGDRITLYGTITENVWNGRHSLQVEIKEIL